MATPTQQKIKSLRLLIAGCGSTGGAFIEGASRLGVLNFRLTEPDHYELHNLNRQFVYPEDTGKNKAIVHAERLNKFFAGCEPSIEVCTSGVSEANIERLLTEVDVVFDAVDVTTAGGMNAKLLLHERAAAKKLLVLSALDLGYKQWIRIFDYRNGEAPLFGNFERASNCKNPIKALFEGFCPLSEMSVEILQEIIRVFQNPGSSFCQIAAPCHLLAGFTGPLLVRIAEKKSLPELLYFDPMREIESQEESDSIKIEYDKLYQQTAELLAGIK